MISRMIARLVALGAVPVSIALIGPSAHAAYHPKYGQTSTAVAHSIGCQRIGHQSSAAPVAKTTLVCHLQGRRINVITFGTERQQTKWMKAVDAAYPNGGYIAAAQGTVIVSYSGDRASAHVGAAALHGVVVRVGY